MDEQSILKSKMVIDKQINKIDRILDKRGSSGQHFDDFLMEERARLFGMLELFWELGGEGYQHLKR